MTLTVLILLILICHNFGTTAKKQMRQVWMYDGSGTADRNRIIVSRPMMDAAAYATVGAGRMLCVHSPDSSSFLCDMTSWPPSWKYDETLSLDSFKRSLKCFLFATYWWTQRMSTLEIFYDSALYKCTLNNNNNNNNDVKSKSWVISHNGFGTSRQVVCASIPRFRTRRRLRKTEDFYHFFWLFKHKYHKSPNFRLKIFLMQFCTDHI